MSKKINDKESKICLTPKQVFCLLYTKKKKKILKKSFLRKSGGGGWNKKRKEGFSNALAWVIKKDPTMPIRKYANELKVHEKTVGTAIKQDLCPDLYPLDYAIWGILENKTNASSHLNIGSLTTAIEEEWNKLSEEFLLKARKSF